MPMSRQSAYDRVAEAAVHGKTKFDFDTEIQPLMREHRSLLIALREGVDDVAAGKLTARDFVDRVSKLPGVR